MDLDRQVATFLDLACLRYEGGDHYDRPAEALDHWSDALAEADLGAAAAVGRSDLVRRHLGADPDAARRPSGPRGWVPLLYLAYGRVDLHRRGESYEDAARALLDAGAAADAAWHPDIYTFTAVTGVFGEGERGTRNQPEHPEAEALAHLLLDAGADPNDGQALYNRMFTAGSRCLEILLAHGLTAEHVLNWGDTDESTLGHQLLWASIHGRTGRARLLLEAGTDPNRPAPDGRLPWHEAWVSGHRACARALEAGGAVPDVLDAPDQLVGALLAGALDEVGAPPATTIAEARGRHGDLCARAVGTGRRDVVDRLLAWGVPLAEVIAPPRLHDAAWAGDGAAIELLLDLGADPAAHDARFGATPEGFARHAGRHAVADRLARLHRPRAVDG